MMDTSARERFVMQILTAPLLRGDAVVVCCGEDASARLNTGAECFRAGCASTLVLTGGHHAPPQVHGAESLAPEALALGIAPHALVVETQSLHTAAQAANVMDIAKVNEWKRMLLVASAYHLPRVMLTFIAAMDRAAMDVHLVPVASTSPWHAPIPGMRKTRLSRLDLEFNKILQYQLTGDCASYVRGLAYLAYVEGK